MELRNSHLPDNHNADVARVIARAWSDPDFKVRLKKDPRVVLGEMGIEILSNVDIKVVENTKNVTYFTLPTSTLGDDVSDEEIESIARNWGAVASGSSECFTCSPCVSKDEPL